MKTSIEDREEIHKDTQKPSTKSNNKNVEFKDFVYL